MRRGERDAMEPWPRLHREDGPRGRSLRGPGTDRHAHFDAILEAEAALAFN